jgi:D-alanyl-D-alanine carboxypeptidase
MALIAKAAYENETFRIITGTARYTIPPTNKHSEETQLQNHNEMLYPWQYYNYVYEYCTGGKTGYTSVARSTLVTYAEKDGMTLICVVMHTESPNQWTDSRLLFDYGFDNFQLLNIADHENRYNDTETVETGYLNDNEPFVDIDQNAGIVMPKTADFLDATPRITYEDTDENVVGSISYTYAGREVGSADIKKTGVKVQGFVFDNQKSEEEKEQDTKTVQIKASAIIVAVLAAVVLIALLIAIKKFSDNYYIIRHNMEVRKARREQFREIKKKKRHKRRR